MKFQIIINGEAQCVSGIDGYGVMSTVITRVKRNPERHKTDEAARSEKLCREQVTVEVGGLDSNSENESLDKYFTHLKKELGIGDEITIKILE